MAICYIGIGSNLGDRRANIEGAIGRIGELGKTRIRRSSTIYETDPVSDVPQGPYLNGVLEVETDLGPMPLLNELGHIEKALGRERTVPKGPRTIDLDILYYGDEKINTKELVVPHPRIQEREFVLKGLRELGKA